MSTEIKNTLYRFVTMRAPELIQDEEIGHNFIRHPQSEATTFTSVFLDAIVNKATEDTKQEVLLETVEEFDAITSKNDLEHIVGTEFYNFAMWLHKNRNSFDLEIIDEEVGKLEPTVSSEFNANEVELWDNLIYQIITYKSNYVREALISVIVTANFLKRYPEDNFETYRSLAQAKVVFPKFLFGAEDNSNSIENQKVDLSSLPLNTKKLQKANELLAIENNKETYAAIKKSLQEAEKRFYRDYQKELNTYNIAYEASVESAYASATEIIKTYTNPVTMVEDNYVVYEDLTLPKYEFMPKGQLVYCLEEAHSDDKIHYNFINYCVEELMYTSFREVYDHIDAALDKLAQLQFKRTVISKKVANVNGVIIDTNAAENYARTVNGFTFLTLYANTNRTNRYLALTFWGMEPGTDIISGEYTITFDDDSTIEGNYMNQSSSSEWVDGKLVLKIFNYAGHYFEAPDEGEMSLTGSFTSSLGRVLDIEGTGHITSVTDPRLSADYLGVDGNPIHYDVGLVLLAKGNGSYVYEDLVVGSSGSSSSNDLGTAHGYANEEPENPPSTTVTSSQNVIQYIPSGYGIKRMGIADYRKVEQEICCYVPGEVSHIENIMAREYKEKSTRRLRRQEDTITTSKEKETEKLTDNTSTDRFEMNQEVSSVLSQQNSSNYHAGISGDTNGIRIESSADFANNVSQEISDHQAVTEAKEITERVLDRVVQKIKEERITKIIEEFEENNKHGYDNRKGDQHISGVYRWIDKIYRNRLVNYGKRLMYEFMIPEPASFHNLATEIRIENNEIETLEKPIDPRTVTGSLALKDFSNVTEATYAHWAAMYNAEVEVMPAQEITLGKSFFIEQGQANNESISKADSIKIDEGYHTYLAKADIAGHEDTAGNPHSIVVLFGNNGTEIITKLRGRYVTNTNSASPSIDGYVNVANFRNEFPVSIQYYNYHVGCVNVSVKCQLTPDAKKQWQIETFNAIITAYEEKLAAYNDKITQLKAAQVEKVKANPSFYRQIENIVLRKNCIEYMISHAALGGTSLLDGDSYDTIRVRYDSIDLETYAGKVKFFEQAFEWDLISYNFYPFYWAEKSKWQRLYNETESDDPLFRAFLQSGMARVVVTVRPGYEEAVNWYMGTGQVWNGGQVPAVDDPLFLSIVNELRNPDRIVEETWESRVPTSLTVIQAGSIGLNVEGLPCDEDCKDYSGFDSDDNPIVNPIQQNPEETQLGNVVEDLETITDSIEEIKNDIQEIKTFMEGLSET